MMPAETSALNHRQISFHFAQKYQKRVDRRVKTEIDEVRHSSYLQGSKIKLLSKSKQLGHNNSKSIDQNNRRKMSNFEILKQQANDLQNEKQLSQKVLKNRMEENYFRPIQNIQFTIGGQLQGNKKIAPLERYRKNIKRQNRNKKQNQTILKMNNSCTSMNSFYPIFQIAHLGNIDLNRQDINLKKKQKQFQCAKKYFRPYSRQHVSSESEIQGKRMKTASDRCQRSSSQNQNIYLNQKILAILDYH